MPFLIGKICKTFFCLCCLGYVDDLKELLFSMPKAAMAQVTAKYKAKTPQPLNTQFEDRLPKAEAVKHHDKRNLKEAVLYPQGKA